MPETTTETTDTLDLDRYEVERIREFTQDVREIQDTVLGYLATIAEVAPRTDLIEEETLLAAIAKVGRLRQLADDIEGYKGIRNALTKGGVTMAARADCDSIEDLDAAGGVIPY